MKSNTSVYLVEREVILSCAVNRAVCSQHILTQTDGVLAQVPVLQATFQLTSSYAGLLPCSPLHFLALDNALYIELNLILLLIQLLSWNNIYFYVYQR